MMANDIVKTCTVASMQGNWCVHSRACVARGRSFVADAKSCFLRERLTAAAAQRRHAHSKTEVVCGCSGFLSQCPPLCADKGGVKSCTCAQGKPNAVCKEDASGDDGGGGGLGGGAIAGIIIGVLLYIACLGGLFFVWTRLPDAEDDDEENYEPNNNNKTEMNNNSSSNNNNNNNNNYSNNQKSSSSPPAKSKYDLDQSPAKTESMPSYASKPTMTYGQSPTPPADDADALLDDLLAEGGGGGGGGGGHYTSKPPQKAGGARATPATILSSPSV